MIVKKNLDKTINLIAKFNKRTSIKRKRRK